MKYILIDTKDQTILSFLSAKTEDEATTEVLKITKGWVILDEDILLVKAIGYVKDDVFNYYLKGKGAEKTA